MFSIAVPTKRERVRICLPHPEFEDQSEVVAVSGGPIGYIVGFIVDLYRENMCGSSC